MLAVTNEFGTLGYGLAATSFFILLLLLLTIWRGNTQGLYILFAVAMSLLWALISAGYAYFMAVEFSFFLFLSELIMLSSWLIVLLKMFSQGRGGLVSPKNKVFVMWYGCLNGGALLLIILLKARVIDMWAIQLLLVIFVALAVLGLVIIEQLYHATKRERRWAVKFIVIGVGSLFAYNFYLYADALLFRHFDAVVWHVRGYAVTLLVPLIALFIVRNPKWSYDIFISRGIAFHSVTLLVIGGYLLVMAGGGYYIQIAGGDWGRAFQILFLFGALILLVVILLSGSFRSRLRVLVNKHFFHYKYDYREEWLGFTRTLSDPVEMESDMPMLVLRALLDIIDSSEGILWVSSDDNGFMQKANIGMSGIQKKTISHDDPLPLFLEMTEWVVNVDEIHARPELYQGFELPDWLDKSEQGWLVAPLIERDSLFAIVLFSHPRSERDFNWEDSDLLKAAGRQAAVSLSQYQMGQALLDARQFEAFNRFSTFVIHDIKNTVAQLSLMVKNSEKHKHNPEFIDDMVETTKNSVRKMERMIAQLRTGKESFVKPEKSFVEIGEVLKEIVAEKSGGEIRPQIDELPVPEALVRAEKDRLVMILGHIVQNGLDATSENGKVVITCQIHGAYVNVVIRDTGTGMSESFLKERLFRPFDSTKGSAGMGIGAYESREYIVQIGGKIEVESEVGSGSTFQVMLPLINDEKQNSDSGRCES